MILITAATSTAEHLSLPGLTTLGIAELVTRARRKLAAADAANEDAFMAAMAQ